MTSVATFALVLSSTLLAAAQPAPAQEVRRHFTVAVAGRELYEFTTVNQLSEREDVTLILLRDHRGGLFVFRRTWTYEGQHQVNEIIDTARRATISVEFDYPYPWKTRSEMIAALRKDSTLMDLADVEATVTTPTAMRTAKESAWASDPDAVEWRAELRDGMPSGTLDLLERMRAHGLFDHEAFQIFWYNIVRKLLYAERCKTDAHAVIRAAVPDCTFDKAFGYGCSERQRERLAKAEKDSRLLKEY
jgi:hypothetical protein